MNEMREERMKRKRVARINGNVSEQQTSQIGVKRNIAPNAVTNAMQASVWCFINLSLCIGVLCVFVLNLIMWPIVLFSFTLRYKSGGRDVKKNEQKEEKIKPTS